MLTGPEIVRQMAQGRITIYPLIPDRINPNSVDLTLDDRLLTYVVGDYETPCLDLRTQPETKELRIPSGGWVLWPGKLYLGSTIEVVGSNHYVPSVEGKSSLGRFGMACHVTAGFVDVGWEGTLTLELTVVHPLRIYAGMRICQVCFHPVDGEIRLYRGKYQGDRGPVPSRSYKDFG